MILRDSAECLLLTIAFSEAIQSNTPQQQVSSSTWAVLYRPTTFFPCEIQLCIHVWLYYHVETSKIKTQIIATYAQCTVQCIIWCVLLIRILWYMICSLSSINSQFPANLGGTPQCQLSKNPYPAKNKASNPCIYVAEYTYIESQYWLHHKRIAW